MKTFLYKIYLSTTGGKMNLNKFFIYIFTPAVALVSTGFVLYSLISILVEGRVSWIEPNLFILTSEILLAALGLFFLIILMSEHIAKLKN